MDKREGRWVTGVGVGLAVFLVGGSLAPGEAWWGIALVLASVLLAVGIGARI